MKKYILIVLIFLAGFIFAGTRNSNFAAYSEPAISTISAQVNFDQCNNFTDYENFITNENLKNLKNSNNTELSLNSPIKLVAVKTFQVTTDLFQPDFKNKKRQLIDSYYNKLNLYPRAP